MQSNTNLKEIDVILSHPHGQIEVPGEKWLLTGPGERAWLSAVAAKSKKTGEVLPISVIPLRYRNNKLSRLLIKLGFLSDPWKPSSSFTFKDRPKEQ